MAFDAASQPRGSLSPNRSTLPLLITAGYLVWGIVAYDASESKILVFAADLEGLSLTAFLVSKLHAAAEETIMRHRVVTLSRAGSISLANALLNPPEPSEALRQAVRDYNEYFENEC
jgi:uncharacterized protein (DUF1778 family)